MATTCDSCRTRFDEAPVRTPTGRSLCPDCGTTFQGQVAGMVAAGSDATPSERVAQGIATGGWLHRVKKAMGRSD